MRFEFFPHNARNELLTIKICAHVDRALDNRKHL